MRSEDEGAVGDAARDERQDEEGLVASQAAARPEDRDAVAGHLAEGGQFMAVKNRHELPAFGEVANRAGRPLTLIEIGPSAGLNLVFDRYGYDYGNGIVAGVTESAVRINSDSRGAPPPVSPLPRVAARLGIDLNPLDVGDSDEMDWLRALRQRRNPVHQP